MIVVNIQKLQKFTTTTNLKLKHARRISLYIQK